MLMSILFSILLLAVVCGSIHVVLLARASASTSSSREFPAAMTAARIAYQHHSAHCYYSQQGGRSQGSQRNESERCHLCTARYHALLGEWSLVCGGG